MTGARLRMALLAASVLAAAVAVAVTAKRSDGENAGRARTDRWVALRPALLTRTEVAAARVGNFIYVVGGFLPQTNATTPAVERYDITANRWRRVRDMPLGVNHPAATAYRGDVYVLDGYTADNALAGETNAFMRYDPESNRWTRMPSAPTRRAALAVGVIGDRLYAAGGATSGGVTFKRLEVFDFGTRRWSRGPDMRFAREHVAGAVAGGAFYVLGGRPGNLRFAERYLPAQNRWQRLPDLRTARSGIAAATVPRGRVVVFGGERAEGTIRPVEMYDPTLRRWLALPGMRTPRHGLGGASLGSRVYSLEGGPRPGFAFSRAIEALDVR